MFDYCVLGDLFIRVKESWFTYCSSSVISINCLYKSFAWHLWIRDGDLTRNPVVPSPWRLRTLSQQLTLR